MFSEFIICPQRPNFYPGGGNDKYLFNCNITPRTCNIRQKWFRILFCCNETFSSFVKTAKYQSNRFVSFLSTIEKKNNPSHTSLA